MPLTSRKTFVLKGLLPAIFVLVATTPSTSDYYAGARFNNEPTNGYYIDLEVSDSIHRTIFNNAAMHWRQNASGLPISSRITSSNFRSRPGSGVRGVDKCGVDTIITQQPDALATTRRYIRTPAGVAELRDDTRAGETWEYCTITLLQTAVERFVTRQDTVPYDPDSMFDQYILQSERAITHEFGHALKLAHSNTGEFGSTRQPLQTGERSIMEDTQYRDETFLVQPYDERQLRAKWGN